MFTKNAKDFKLYQKEENIVEISRVTIPSDELSLTTIDVKETVSGKQIASALQTLRELPCKDPSFEPQDAPYGECFMIKYADGSFQLLSECRNDYFDKAYNSQGYQSLDFDDDEFYSLWNHGFGSIVN
ncbi:MAG: hypothetical protein IJJ99_01210 [Oscillospiraceae bacterium]|nr:hypothetical protein [Oscillospiraceae bacterium]